MKKNRISVATIDAPEFVKITSISPTISKCEIKVLYVGENRNRSFITKEVATNMAQTLPGVPIIGSYVESKEDFIDHGERMIIDGEGIRFEKTTKPYGFVAPDAKIWFKKFEETDEFGNTEIREYLMTEGYLWTKLYKEALLAVDEGRPQSMELDEDTLKGYWSEDTQRGIEFFIINDATFSSLCILGEDVEPCFEGASVTSPQVSSEFAKSDFNKSLFTMMKELRYTLETEKGGNSMEENTVVTEVEEPEVEVVEEPAAEEPEVEVPETEVQDTENFSNEEDNSDKSETPENENITEEFTKEEEDEDKKSEDEKSEDNKDESDDSKEDEDEKKKYELLESEYAELQNKYSLLEEENQKLIAFKQEVEDERKEAMIASFSMLSDEDKKDVIANKATYTLDEIKAKLSIICVDKKVNFNAEKAEEPAEKPAMTYNLDAHDQDEVPAWLKTVKNIHDNNNN